MNDIISLNPLLLRRGNFNSMSYAGARGLHINRQIVENKVNCLFVNTLTAAMYLLMCHPGAAVTICETRNYPST